MHIDIKTVHTQDFDMDYCKFGSGKQAFVIVPGLSVTSVMPSAQAIADAYRLLQEDYSIYVFDRRKGKLPASYSIQDMAEDLVKAICILDLRKVSIFGASQGGMITMEIAIHHPELVDKIILGSTAAKVTKEQFQVINQWITYAQNGQREELYLDFGEKVYDKEVFANIRNGLAEASKTVTGEDLSRFVILAQAIDGFSIVPDLKQITCPVLVLGSQTDEVLSGAASEEIIASLENSAHKEIHMYSGFGHGVYDCAPDYQERILAFLKS